MSKPQFSDKAWEEFVYWLSQDKKNYKKDFKLNKRYFEKRYTKWNW